MLDNTKNRLPDQSKTKSNNEDEGGMFTSNKIEAAPKRNA
jgi:hypothetical protein